MATSEETDQIFSKSLPSYDSIEGGSSERRGNAKRSGSSTTVYCIHGNTFGIARCCDELSQGCSRRHSAGSPCESGGEGDGGDASENEPLISDPHCHDAGAGNQIDRKARRKLIVASVLCLVFMIVEVVGGFVSGSLAIATDAAHLLTDFASFMISLFSIWVASRPATTNMSFGWHRAEVIGATVSVLLIWVVTGILFYSAVLRVVNMQFDINPTIMLITSAVGVGVNIIMGCSLHQPGHGHSHGGGGGGDEESGEPHSAERTNVNVKAAFIHVIGDFVQSMGVFLAALIIYFRPDYKIADPICTFIFSVLVLLTTIRILRDTMNVLMEGIPRDVSFNIVQELFMSVEGIVAVHDLRIWGLTTDKTALSAHLVIAANVNEQQVLKTASTKIRTKYNIYEMTLQVERFQSEMDSCGKCQPPVK